MTLQDRGSEKAGEAPRADRPSGGGPSNLVVRFLSAVVLAPVFLAAVWLGGWAFLFVMLLAALLCYREWVAISAKNAPALLLLVGYGGLVVAGFFAGFGMVLSALGSVAATALFVGLVSATRNASQWPALGILYVGLPLVSLLTLRHSEAGAGVWALAIVLAVTWSTDIAAYFTGRTLGGPKLWPSVSPKKTWSGAIGGLIGAVTAGVAVVLISGIGSLVAVAILSVVLSILSQSGDLAESAFKRHFGVKDSGTLIPGHGGIMDRVDGLVMAALGAFVIGLAVAMVLNGSRDAALALSML